MMKRFGNMCAIVTLVTGVSVGAALAQVPPLGFTIDPTTGIRGTTVNGQVNPADVAANCVTDLTAFEAEFEAVFTGPYAGGGTGGDLFPRFFPGGDFVFENTDQTAYVSRGFVVLGISADINGAAETALPQTFVMTFADFAQNPLGTLGHFDPVTGVGSVTVPDITPGQYPVAATCVRPTLDVDMLEAGIRKNGAFLASIGVPPDINSQEFQDFVTNYPGANGDLFRVPQSDRTDPHPEHRDTGCVGRAALHHHDPDAWIHHRPDAGISRRHGERTGEHGRYRRALRDRSGRVPGRIPSGVHRPVRGRRH